MNDVPGHWQVGNLVAGPVLERLDLADQLTDIDLADGVKDGLDLSHQTRNINLAEGLQQRLDLSH